MNAEGAGTPVLEITNVSRQYSGLRPLRLRSLCVRAGERVAILGLDAAGAELFVSLVTGAGLPDEGQVCVLGTATSTITDGEQWLASLDRFGIVTARAVLLEGATLAQNLAIPFTLEIDPIPTSTREAVDRLAAECGIPADSLDRPAVAAPPEIVARAHVARALACRPALLLLDHPTAMVPEPDRRGFADDVRRVCDARGQTMVAITQDQAFAAVVAHRVLTLQPATGVLVPARRKGWLW